MKSVGGCADHIETHEVRGVLANKAIALVDLWSGGHHDSFMEGFCKVLLKAGAKVGAIYPDPKGLRCWADRSLRATERNRLDIHDINVLHRRGFRSRRFQVLNRWFALRRAVRNLAFKPDLVFLMSADDFRFPPESGSMAPVLQWIASVTIRTPWSGLYFHPLHLRSSTYACSLGNFDVDKIFRMKLCLSVAVLDEGVTSLLQSRIGKQVINFPDFADFETRHSTAMGDFIRKEAKGRAVVSLLGALQKRKGVLQFLRIIELLPSSDYYFCLIGFLFANSFDANERSIIKAFTENLPENVFVHTEAVEDAEFEDVISSSKILFAVYQDFPHSSNMLAKAAKYKVPVIVADSYCMAERVKTFGLGLTVKQNDAVGAVFAIERLNRFGARNPQWEEYSRLHSVNRIVEQFQIILQ